MNQTDTAILQENNKSVKEAKNFFENQRKRAQTVGTNNNPQPETPRLASNAKKGDSAWIKQKADDSDAPTPRPFQPMTPKKSSPKQCDSARKIDNDEENSVRNQIKKFEEISKKNVEKQQVIKKLEEKIVKREEKVERSNSTYEKPSKKEDRHKVYNKENVVYEKEKVHVRDVVTTFDPSKRSQKENQYREDYNTTLTEVSMDVSRLEIPDLDESQNLSVVHEGLDGSHMVTPNKESRAPEVDLNQTNENTLTPLQAAEILHTPPRKTAEKKAPVHRPTDDTEVPDESFHQPDDSVRSNDILTKTGLDNIKKENQNGDAFVAVATSSTDKSDEKIDEFGNVAKKKRTCKDVVKRIFSCLVK